MNRIKKYFTALALVIGGYLAAQVNLSQSLTACYALDGNGTEPINNLTATLSAVTPTVDRFNNSSSAFQFNGTATSIIELPDDPLLKPYNAFSFSCWMKTTSLVDQSILMTKNMTFSNFESYDLHIGNANGGLKARAKKGDGTGASTIVTGTTAINQNTWYHLVITVDNNNLMLYTNGVLDASATTTYTFNYQAGKKVILGGTNEPNFNIPFTGSMDNIRFYNRVLAPAEVSQLYATDPSCLNTAGLHSFSFHVNDIKATPNPSAGKFIISTEEEINIVEVQDMLGNTVLSSEDKTVDLTAQANGVYLLKVKLNGRVSTYKIVKQ